MSTLKQSRLVTLAAIFAIGAVVLGAPAQAEPVDQNYPSIAVNYADLNLGSEEGVDALYRRLRAAAARVCRGFESREIQKLVQHRACIKQALAGAVSEINHETLTALHQSHLDRNAIAS